MNKRKTINSGKRKQEAGSAAVGDSEPVPGGELHQIAGGEHPPLTTNQGVVLSDNQNSLKASPRDPALLEDFILCGKITHFDHERIPESGRVYYGGKDPAMGPGKSIRALA